MPQHNPPVQVPILLDIPDAFETERLLIRSPLPGDSAALQQAILESVEELREWMIWPLDQSLETIESMVRETRAQFLQRTDFRLHLFEKATGDLIGCSGLHRIDWRTRRFEIGYWMRTPYSGKGYMTEAVAGITKFAIDVLLANRIEIRCDPENVRSRRIPERLGFTLEGVLRQNTMNRAGQLCDTNVYAKVRGIEF